MIPAATNLGSYSDKSNFFNKPASVCGCFAPPPPTLPPKIPHDAGPPSSPQEMSNMGVYGSQALAASACRAALKRRRQVATAAIDAFRATEAARLALPGCRDAAPILSVPERCGPAR